MYYFFVSKFNNINVIAMTIVAIPFTIVLIIFIFIVILFIDIILSQHHNDAALKCSKPHTL